MRISVPDANCPSFFKMISPVVTGGVVINYSSRFSFSGMTGTFPAAITTALQSISGTDPPPTVDQYAAQVGAEVSATTAVGSFAVPFSLQTGPTKYAPMLQQPGSKITAKKTAPLYPTSSYELARTPFAPATVATTITQPATGNPSSIANTVRISHFLSEMLSY
jgi:hypothetical protein